MSGFNINLLQDPSGGASSSGGVNIRDYQHASRVFRPNSYQNAPKLKFLFHTYFTINPSIATSSSSSLQTLIQGSLSSVGISLGGGSNSNYGLMVKDVKLPTFTFNTTQLNQYNRKRIVQTKIKYEPIDITFHDDNANQINKLWQAYYAYYYNDSTKPGSVLQGGGLSNLLNTAGNLLGIGSGSGGADYNSRNIYNTSISGQDDWGFVTGQTTSTGVRQSFFKNITVFGFNQHQFTAYTLINPIITSFSHDTYAYAEGGGTMSNKMTIDYETVVYNYGTMDGQQPGQIVTGFGDPANYDNTLSPIALEGSNSAALGQGGLVNAVGGAIEAIVGGSHQVAAAIQSQNAAYNAFQSPSNNSVPNAIGALLSTVLGNAPTNRNTPFSTPVAQSTPGPAGTAGAPVIGGTVAPPSVADDAVYTQGGNTYSATNLAATSTPENSAALATIFANNAPLTANIDLSMLNLPTAPLISTTEKPPVTAIQDTPIALSVTTANDLAGVSALVPTLPILTDAGSQYNASDLAANPPSPVTALNDFNDGTMG
jgi:hypothetical protein